MRSAVVHSTWLFQTQNIIYHSHHIPIADTGDWLYGITITVILSSELPPFNTSITVMTPDFSPPV